MWGQTGLYHVASRPGSFRLANGLTGRCCCSPRESERESPLRVESAERIYNSASCLMRLQIALIAMVITENLAAAAAAATTAFLTHAVGYTTFHPPPRRFSPRTVN